MRNSEVQPAPSMSSSTCCMVDRGILSAVDYDKNVKMERGLDIGEKN